MANINTKRARASGKYPAEGYGKKRGKALDTTRHKKRPWLEKVALRGHNKKD
jgi:hypothetical protein